MSTFEQQVEQMLEQRFSANKFDATKTISDAQIQNLTRLATLAPNCFNMQNWKFVAVRTPADKKRLQAAAMGQQKVADASVTFIVCGVLEPANGIEHAWQPALKKGAADEATVKNIVATVTGLYANQPQKQRDEAIRSASLAGMTLMVAAQAQGLVSGPMIGFDPAAVAREFQLSPLEIPALLIAVGYEAPGNWPQKPRLPVQEVLRIV